MSDYRAIAREAVGRHGALQKEGELAAFLEVLGGLRPQVVVEIGCDAGGTLWAWQQLAPLLLVGIDRPYPCLSTGRKRDCHGARVIEGDSHDAATLARLKEVLGGLPVDFLFIDGDHTYEGVKKDFTMYAPLVAPGGLVAFHDIVPHVGQPQVQVHRFWGEINGVVKSEITTDETSPGHVTAWGGLGWVKRK